MSDELQAFVVAEARLLDERRFSIGSRFAADGAYWAPTPARAALARGGALLFYETRALLEVRVAHRRKLAAPARKCRPRACCAT